MKDYKLVSEQKIEIEAQSDEIKSINDNLEAIVRDRTQQLERKNKALEEYAFINAHKLRGPLASILGLVQLISRKDMSDEERILVDHLQRSAENLDKVIRSITQSIEKAD